MRVFLLVALMALMCGFYIGWVFTHRYEENRSKGRKMRITRVLFLIIMGSALVWVFISYGLAIYSTVALGQVYTMAELSEPAITSLLGTVALKVLENVFEHNDGGIFGHSRKDNEE